MSALSYHHPAVKVTAWVLIACAYLLAGKIGLGFASVNVSASPLGVLHLAGNLSRGVSG
jgi:hypothetical protein